MNINPRSLGNLALGVGLAALVALRWVPLQFADAALSAGIILTAVGLLLRLVAPDSRAKYARGGAPDCVNCGVIAAALVAAWWNSPPAADAPYHHNDGGDIFAIVILPFIWVPVTGLLLLFRVGMACQPKAPSPPEQ